MVVLAAFAAGGVVGFMLKEDGAPAGRAARTVIEQPAEAAPTLDRESARSLREMLEALPIDPVPTGNGRVTGVVKTDDGNPLAGVEFVAMPNRQRVWTKRSRAPARPPEPDLVGMVQQSVSYARWSRDGARKATSAADGSFALEGLGDVEYHLSGYSAGYRLQRKDRGTVRAGAAVEFEAKPLVRIEVDIAVEGSGAPEKANVHFTQRRGNGSSGSSQRWTPSEPWIELEPGRFEIHASLEGELGGKSEVQHLTIKEGDTDLRLSLTIKLKPALRLTIQVPDTIDVSYLQGWLLRAAGDNPPSCEELRNSGVRQSAHRSQRTMLWKDLEPGRYLVGATFGAFQQSATTALVEVSTGLTEHLIDLPEPSGEGVIRVRLLDPDGAPAGGVQWTIAHRKGGSSSSGGQNSLVRKDGIHLLSAGNMGPFEGGVHTITASTPTWGALSSLFDPTSSGVLEMRFAKPAEVVGQITGYAGSGYEGKVRFQFEDPANRPQHVWFHGKSRIDDSGKMQFDPQQPGERVLALYVKAGRHDMSPLAEQPVSLRPGKQSVMIAMPTLYSLRVVWGGEGKPQVGLQRVRPKGARRFHSGQRQTNVGKDGVVTFKGLMPGRYTVFVYGARKGKRPVVEIPAQSEIRIP